MATDPDRNKPKDVENADPRDDNAKPKRGTQQEKNEESHGSADPHNDDKDSD